MGLEENTALAKTAQLLYNVISSRIGEETVMKFISWNVNGLRACLKKGFLDFYQGEKPDFCCL